MTDRKVEQQSPAVPSNPVALLRCPFCSGSKLTTVEDAQGRWTVQCADCLACGPRRTNVSEIAALDWNERASPDETPDSAGVGSCSKHLGAIFVASHGCPSCQLERSSEKAPEKCDVHPHECPPSDISRHKFDAPQTAGVNLKDAINCICPYESRITSLIIDPLCPVHSSQNG